MQTANNSSNHSYPNHNNRNDKGNDIPIGWIVAGAVLFLLALLAYTYREPIMRQVADWKRSYEAQRGHRNDRNKPTTTAKPADKPKDVATNHPSAPVQTTDVKRPTPAPKVYDIRALRVFTDKNKYGVKYTGVVYTDSNYGNGATATSSTQKNEPEVVIAAGYDFISDLHQVGSEIFALTKKQGKWRIINMQEKPILAAEYRSAVEAKFPNPYWTLNENGTYGVICYNDLKMAIPMMYDSIGGVNVTSCITVKKNGLYGCVDISNNVVIPIKYQNMVNNAEFDRLRRGYVRAWNNGGENVYYNTKGETLTKEEAEIRMAYIRNNVMSEVKL